MKRTLPGIVLVLLVTGCRRSSALDVRDTEDRSARVQCDGSGRCVARSPGLELRTPGRLMLLCDSGSTDPGRCRALVCGADGDCPNAKRTSSGSCVNGLCIEPSGELSTGDAVALCLAGTGPGRQAPLQVERYAMALNCGKPCRVPKPCRQP